ncbi:hypothetical protein BCV08_12855 [Vibrio breoganii]|uniref:GGDEF domain-containing protein n=1 Tax=Vibrio breoganii TaxID=553239 RepID=UPI000C860B73|nr:GGDEF domain-containing protein [Vibrio breoganii]PMF87537.1 hypothetical protein BCV08_12855 [Vibrio breoganii]
MKLIPALFYFDRETEKAFQHSLNERSRSNVAILSYLSIAIFLAFFIFSFIIETNIKSADNLNRLLIAAVFLPLGVFTAKADPKNLDTLWFYLGCGLSVLMGAFFFNYAQRHDELYEGGPMLAAMVMSAIPILHLGEKLILWGLLGISLLSIQLLTSVDIIWSLNFYALTIVVIGVMQYHTDILLRSQYKYEMLEKDKAQTDKLTGVHNRHSFDIKFADLLSGLRQGQHLCIAIIDIDYFKDFNDYYGHLEGDRVLIQVARLLSVQPSDLVVRFGGEEFILLKVSDDENSQWLKQLPSQFKQLNIPHVKSDTGYVTVSIGIATLTKKSHRNITKKQLLSAADECLYQAKLEGRNRICSKAV